jgi:Fe-S cluster assembly ATP-binding protein
VLIRDRKAYTECVKLSLRTVDLSISIDDKVIVKNVSIEAMPGEPVFLLGPNGSGKSSLLKGIMGIPSYKIVSGKVIMDSEDITGLPPWERVRRGLWIVHQLNFPLSVPTYFLLEKIAARARANVNIKAVLDALGISHLYYREAFNGFSGGEAKKLEVATALVSRPICIMLDEPDSGVDIDSLRVIAGYINLWLRDGRTIIIVTHLGAIANFIEKEGKAYVLIDGRIVYEGRLHDVIRLVLEKGYSYFKGDGN